jgi:hypothetical protein
MNEVISSSSKTNNKVDLPGRIIEEGDTIETIKC